jgi:Ca-activated chloride channel family protein
VALFGADTRVGLWAFSTKLDGGKDYRQLVPLGPLTDTVSAGRSRRDALLAAIDGLKTGGDTALYDTAVAAQKAVLSNYRDNATNLVVLMTDGKNDNPAGGLTLEQATQNLKANFSAAKPVRLVTVGYGGQADFAALQAMSRATSALSYASPSAFDINKVLLSAIFGRT